MRPSLSSSLILGAFLLLFTASAAARITSEQIDAYLEAAQARSGVEPAPLCSDEEFLRRLSLDVRGVIPSVEETISFLNDSAPDKRARAIETALQSPERGDHWSTYWDKVLLGTLEQPTAPEAQRAVKEPFRNWVSLAYNQNASYKDFMKDVVTATGSAADNPATLPAVRWKGDAASAAGTMSRAFLGKQIQCAQCHDHKDDPTLTQQKFWEFTTFFSTTRVRNVPQDQIEMKSVSMGGEGDAPAPPRFLQRFEVYDLPKTNYKSELPEIRPKQYVQAKYLDGTPAARKAHNDLRDQLADFMERRDREQFATNFANRLWSRHFGRGFLEPVDAWGMGRDPDHPELLRALAAHFVETGYDVRNLERLILNTRAYQRSSVPTHSSAREPELFAHAAVRPLAPEQLLDSLERATGIANVTERYGRPLPPYTERLRTKMEAQFVHVFGNDEMEWTNTFNGSIPQALLLLNDATVTRAVSFDKGGTLHRISEKTKEPEQFLTYLTLAALSRNPTPDEMSRFLAAYKTCKTEAQRKALAEDQFWAFLASTEFMTNH